MSTMITTTLYRSECRSCAWHSRKFSDGNAAMAAEDRHAEITGHWEFRVVEFRKN